MTAARWLALVALGLLSCGAAAQDEYTLLVFGDGGSGNATQRRVAAAMAQACAEAGCDAALVLGDLIYPSGVRAVDDRKFATHFEAPYAVLGPFPFWMAPGNHDHRGSVEAQVAYGRSGRSERWRMPAAHYAVAGLPSWLHVYSLDTEPIDEQRAESVQADEARAALCGKPGWRLLMGHHPIYSNGRHGDNDAIGRYLADVIRDCDVHAYFAGHDHHQEHIAAPLLDQFVQGAATKLRRVRTRRYPEAEQLTQRFARSTLGFAIAAFTARTMEVRFFDATDGRAEVIYRCEAAVDVPGCAPL
jgi:tartrate-resistant acid phosphatase type 5